MRSLRTKGTQAVAADILKRMPGITEACVIYPCSPMLTVDDLKEGKRVLAGNSFAFGVGTDPLQDAGCFYWGRAIDFGQIPLIGQRTAMVPIPANRVCDINTMDDWVKAESMFDALKAIP